MPLRLGSVRLKLSHASRAPSGDQAEQKVNKVAGACIGSSRKVLVSTSVMTPATGGAGEKATLLPSGDHPGASPPPRFPRASPPTPPPFRSTPQLTLPSTPSSPR